MAVTIRGVMLVFIYNPEQTLTERLRQQIDATVFRNGSNPRGGMLGASHLVSDGVMSPPTYVINFGDCRDQRHVISIVGELATPELSGGIVSLKLSVPPALIAAFRQDFDDREQRREPDQPDFNGRNPMINTQREDSNNEQ